MRNRLSCLVLLSAVVGIVPQKVAGFAQEMSVDYEFGSRPVPKWENGFLIAYRTVKEPSAVFLFNRSGQIALQTKIEIPNYGEIKIFDVTASSDGKVAIAASGTGVGPFVAWLGSTGAIERVINTKDFPIIRVRFAPDGTLWGMGHFLDHSIRRPEDIPDHTVLHHYSRDGQLLHSVLPRSSFGGPTWQSPDELALLAISTDRVGVYIRTTNEWVEVSFSGDILGCWKGVEFPGHFDVIGVGLLSDQSLYVSAQFESDPAKRTIDTVRIFSLDKQTGMWKPLRSTRELESKMADTIYGADGNKLLVRSGRSSFTWIQP